MEMFTCDIVTILSLSICQLDKLETTMGGRQVPKDAAEVSDLNNTVTIRLWLPRNWINPSDAHKSPEKTWEISISILPVQHCHNIASGIWNNLIHFYYALTSNLAI